MKLLKLNLICIINCTTSKKGTEIWTVIFLILNLNNLNSAAKKTARFLLAGACDSYVPCVRCFGWKPLFTLTYWDQRAALLNRGISMLLMNIHISATPTSVLLY